MGIEQTKARVKELLSRVKVPNNPCGEPNSSLEVDEWVELDTIKHELARDIDGVSFIGSGSDRGEIYYGFFLGDRIATSRLIYNINQQKVHVAIDFIGYPLVGNGHGYCGDDNQAWILFNALPVEHRKHFIEIVTRTHSALPEQVLIMIGNNPPAASPSPACVLPRVTDWLAPTP